MSRNQPWCAPTDPDEQTVPSDKSFNPLGIILAGRNAVAAAAQLEVVPASLPEQPADYLSCMAGGETYVIAIDRVREALRARRITQVPRAPESITGIISHRGSIMPVVDLAHRLGIVRDIAPGSGWIIVIRRENGCCGLRVDNVGSVITLPASVVEPPTSVRTEYEEFLSGMACYRGAMVMVLNLEKVFAVGATLL